MICNSSNKAKIRPILLSFGGIPDSGKTRAVSHLLNNYVDQSPFEPMTKINERLEAEGITYYELVAAGFHPLRNLTITEVTKESSCAFGILSAFKEELLTNGVVPLFKFYPGGPLRIFGDPDLDDHLYRTFSYLSQHDHTPKGSVVTSKEQKYATRLKKLLPEGIALINIWDIAINKTVRHFLTSLRGLLYNSHTWLFLDIEQDLQKLDKPPEIPEEPDRNAVNRDWSVLMKWRPRLHYLLRLSRMGVSTKDLRKSVCTIFAKHKGVCNKELKQKVVELEAKVQQAAKQIGVSALIEPKVVSINFNDSNIPRIHDDHSHHLYQKFQQVIYETPYKDVPLSWVFLRSLFYRSAKKFISKSELKEKANKCGMDDNSLTKFCEFYTSFGSIFDLSLVNPDYPYVIVKPMGFLKSLDKFLCPDDSTCKDYPTLINGIIPEKACEEAFGEDWSAYMEALVSVNLATKVPGSKIEAPNLDNDHTYYYIPLSRNESHVTEADPTAVHLITSINTPHVFKQATFAKLLLRSLPEPKLVPCSNINQTIIRDSFSGTTITLISHSPATKIAVDQANSEACSLIVEAYNKIAETCQIGTTKYKFVMICAKNGVTDAKDIPSCQYHVLPNDTLCDKCKEVGRVNDQLQAWNQALKEVSDYICYNKLIKLNFSVQFLQNVYQVEVSLYFYFVLA